MSNNIVYLPATSTNMSVEQALHASLNSAGALTEVLILGWTENGELHIGSSKLNVRDALWLCETAKLHILNLRD